MPIFEYKCRKCKDKFEVLFRSRDESLAVACPKCGSSKVERMMSAFAGKVGNTASGGAGCGGCTASSCGSCHGH